MIVAVVGSGPSCINCGQKIDASDVVIRLADCHWQNEKDHGTKYDIGLIRDSEKRWLDVEEYKKAGVLRYPKQWWAYRVDISKNFPNEVQRDLNSFLDLPVRYIHSSWAQRAGGLQGREKITRGTAMVMGALMFLPIKELHLYGLDTILSGARTKYHPGFGVKVARGKLGDEISGSHVYKKDKQVIDNLASQFGVRVYNG